MKREDFVNAAKSCIGTRFHHQGRVKGVGLDCAGLVIVAAKEVGLSLSDMNGYGRIPDGDALLKHCSSQNVEKVSLSESIPGDVILMSFDKDPQHLAIVTKNDGTTIDVVHSWLQPRKVVENTFPDDWKRRVVAVFRLKELD